MTQLHTLPLPAFRDFLLGHGIERFYLVWDAEAERVRPSHEALQPLADLFDADRRDFNTHEGFFVEIGPESRAIHGACVHRTCRGQGAGGVRFWHYANVEDYLRDGLRLAQGMTYKNALAGLWWGGGKGVIAREGAAPDAARRRGIYAEYGAFITSLAGCYVTAEDVGTSVDDMAAVFSNTRFTTCIPARLGGSGNPSVPTARGVVRGMEAALAHLGLGELRGKSVAVQGLGHVGEPLVGFLFERGVARIVGADVDADTVAAIGARYPELQARAVAFDDPTILAEAVDIVAPCATGGVLNERTIPTLRAKVVCGAANNQLEDPERDDLRLREAGVLYAPDFLVNRMGIVNCADEQFGYVDPDPVFAKHLGDTWDNSIFNLCRRVFAEAERTGETPARVALAIADERSRQEHPLSGHRGAAIIRSLVDAGWERGP